MPHIEMSRTEVKVKWKNDPQRNARSRRRIVERDGIPELVSAVDSGRIPLSRAREIARFPREQQVAAIASAKPRGKAGRPPNGAYRTADAKALSGGSAQERLRAAITRQLREQQLAWERRLSEAVHAQIRKIMPDLEKEKQDAFFDQQFYQKLALGKAVFTDEEWMAITRCLHPDMHADSAAKIRAQRAFQLMQDKRGQLTGKRK